MRSRSRPHGLQQRLARDGTGLVLLQATHNSCWRPCAVQAVRHCFSQEAFLPAILLISR